MTAVLSQGELVKEALVDAPDGQYIDIILQDYNQFKRAAIKAFKNGITNADNTPNKEKLLNLEHGVEYEVSNPMSVPVKGVSAIQCDGVSLDSMGASTGSFYPLDMPVISWRPTGKSSGSVYIKALFPALSTQLAGQSVSSALAYTSGITLMSGTAADIVSVSLPIGQWDLAMMAGFYGNGGTPVGTALYACIGANSASLDGVPGDTLSETSEMPTAITSSYVYVPQRPVTVTTATTYYLVAKAVYSVGTIKGFGRLSATRVEDYTTGIVGRVNLLFYGG